MVQAPFEVHHLQGSLAPVLSKDQSARPESRLERFIEIQATPPDIDPQRDQRKTLQHGYAANPG